MCLIVEECELEKCSCLASESESLIVYITPYVVDVNSVI